MEEPDFTAFERELADQLIGWGFEPRVGDNGVTLTTPSILGVFRTQCSLASADEGNNAFFSLAVEVSFSGLHPVWLKVEHSEMITEVGTSAELTLRKAATRYAQTTLSCVLSFFTEDHATGFEGVELDPYYDQFAPEGGIHLTVSAPYLTQDLPDAERYYNALIENPLFRFIPQSLAEVVGASNYQIVTVSVRKSSAGEYSGEVLVNGVLHESATVELIREFSAFSHDWGSAEAFQTFILQPSKVVDEEHWRLETKDPISDPDHDSFATCAVDQKLEPFHYLLNFHTNLRLMKKAGVLIALGALLFIPGWKVAAWIVMTPGLALGALVFFVFFAGLKYNREKFKYTLLTPGIITSTDPVKVLVLAPLAKSSFAPDRGEAFRYLKKVRLPGHRLEVGERIPVASSFRVKEDDTMYWGDFSPEPVCWAVSDREKLQESVEKLGEYDFEVLERYLISGRVPPWFPGMLRADKLPPPVPVK